MSEFIDQISFAPIIPTRPYTKPIGFTATAVYVDNYTAYWLFFKDAQRFVPPYYVGVCLLLITSTGNEYVEVKSPYTPTQSPTDPSYSVNLKWTDNASIFNPGVDISAQATNIVASLAGIQAGITQIEANTGVGGTLEVDLATLIRNTGGLITMVTNQLTVGDRASMGGHNLSIAQHPYAANTFFTLFNNSPGSTPFYVLNTDAALFGTGKPIYPRVEYSATISSIGTLDIYIVAPTGTTVDVRQQYGTYS